MAKVVDITEKLNFDENPRLAIRGTELEVNTDAATVLKVMGIVGDGSSTTPGDIVDLYNLIFPEKSREVIDQMKLNFTDFNKVIECAINLVVGEEEDEGEAQTHTTT